MPPKQVLIVDDEKRMADSLRDLLNGAGYHADAVYSGRAAIQQLDQRSYNVVVTDLRMQGLDGLDLIRHVHEFFPLTLIIVITGHATTESAIQAVHFGVFDYLRKPFEFDLFRMAIEKAFHKLETEQLREDTAAMISHDIKVPLTSIIGFAAMVADPQTGELHPRAAEFAATIHANGQKILELIDNYLTSCRIEAGTLKPLPVPVDPKQMVLDVIEMMQIEAMRAGRRIETHFDNLPELARLDEMLMFRAIANMLQNAIKYSDGPLPVEVRVERLSSAESPLETDTLAIIVINETHELMPEELGEIFDRYTRHSAHVRLEGSGIGLYVVRAVAEAHGGRASAELLEQSRACFYMLVPLQVVDGQGRHLRGPAVLRPTE